MVVSKNKEKNVLITGASSGFGAAFAEVFAREGYNLVLQGRSKKNIIDIATDIKSKYDVEVDYFLVDLTEKDACFRLFEFVRKKKISINCLVNNAGIGNYGRFAENSLTKERELIELNIAVVAELCHRFIPLMTRNGGGKILNIASLAAFQPGAYYATYYASKAFVLLFSEALALEYKVDNITVSALCPGPSQTKFFEKAGMVSTSRLLQSSMMQPLQIAESGYEGLMAGKAVIIPSLKYRFIPFGSRVLPRSVVARINKKLIEIIAKG